MGVGGPLSDQPFFTPVKTPSPGRFHQIWSVQLRQPQIKNIYFVFKPGAKNWFGVTEKLAKNTPFSDDVWWHLFMFKLYHEVNDE